VLLLPGLDPQEALDQVTAIIVALGAELPLVVDDTHTIVARPSASVGLAVPADGDTFSDVLRHADIALYHAKRQRTGPRLHTPDLRQPAAHRQQGEEMLEPC
jgi:predicted signal transduction protein with EAL and GGDEF domain